MLFACAIITIEYLIGSPTSHSILVSFEARMRTRPAVLKLTQNLADAENLILQLLIEVITTRNARRGA